MFCKVNHMNINNFHTRNTNSLKTYQTYLSSIGPEASRAENCVNKASTHFGSEFKRMSRDLYIKKHFHMNERTNKYKRILLA